MDHDDELKRFKNILIAGSLFLISGCFSFTELKYACLGNTADAHVAEAKRWLRGRRQTPQIDLKYSYQEADGTSRGGRDDVPESWVPGDLITVQVQYIPGAADSSRIKASERLVPVYFFAATVVWFGYAIFKLTREANTPIARGPRRRNR